MNDPLERLAPIRLGPDMLGDLEAAERREFWLANGRGGYAAGTTALSLTRRYHGCLIAPVDPPLGRSLVLTKADATVTLGGVSYPLFTNRWTGGTIAPDAYCKLQEFYLDGTIPVWRFCCGDAVVEHRIWLEPACETVYLAWKLEGAPEAWLGVTFLANGRDHHGETWPPNFNPELRAEGLNLTVNVPWRFTLDIAGSAGHIEPRDGWYENFDLPVERERGLGDRDAHRHVGDGFLPLTEGRWVGYAASLNAAVNAHLGDALERRRAADRAVVEQAVAADPVYAAAPGWVLRLVLAADLYRIARPIPEVPDGRSVIAGYPWFGDWGRDTMISLPGLCLATGRFDEARLILETFARFVDGGMLPNMFPGAGETPDYNTVDAALWFIEAWRAYVAATEDEAALRRTFPVLASIVDGYTKGTRYGIAVDPADGLVRAGVPGVQLTWMDARVGDWVVTPRIGKPVEINALWYNALVAMAAMAEQIGESGDAYKAAADKAKAGFKRFVRRDGPGLYDVIDGPGGDDPSLRPNQVFAVSLPESPLAPAAQRAVIEACTPLVTQYGLRSLAPDHPDYKPRITGSVPERDGAYHQGTVWGFLLGHWALATFRVGKDAAAAQELLAGIEPHLSDAGLGQISEVFDADPPHTPRGCPAQAWSVACTLEAWWKLEHAKKPAQTTRVTAAPKPAAAPKPRASRAKAKRD